MVSFLWFSYLGVKLQEVCEHFSEVLGFVVCLWWYQQIQQLVTELMSNLNSLISPSMVICGGETSSLCVFCFTFYNSGDVLCNFSDVVTHRQGYRK